MTGAPPPDDHPTEGDDEAHVGDTGPGRHERQIASSASLLPALSA